jgi:hypothetical protein
MRSLFTLLLLLSLTPATAPKLCAQKSVQDAILAEGKALYRLEKAAWVGTDMLREQFPEEMEHFGGYVTYSKKELTYCTFFTNDSISRVMAVYAFDSTFTVSNSTVERVRQSPTEEELRLRHLRSSAYRKMQTDTIFNVYNNSNLNVVPMVYQGKAKVYVLTGPSIAGVVIFGNDYLIEFDDDDQVESARPLHRNIIPIKYTEEQTSSSHSHTKHTGSFMTPTDICTLMLYGPFTSWDSHTVLSQTHWNIWDIERNTMAVLTRKAMEKIKKHQKKLAKKRKRQSGN